ncbi:MAG: metallophosphoesterase [Candidatus Aenigmarchaeota archaeon]|nr:metallophosphoesterase [Candidatus Aenigmarchaeota archaeon]
MLIAATSDVHSPKFYEDFVIAIDNMQVKPDLFILAGDMIERGSSAEEYERVYNTLFGKVSCPIVACFGNNEFIPDIRDEIKQKMKDIKFLDNESMIIKYNVMSVGIVGTIGSLDIPTNWQKIHIPNIEKVYQERLEAVEKHLHRMLTHYKIVIMHYAPTYKTLVGENPRFYGGMGSFAYENVFLKEKPNLVIHGHSHRGLKQAMVDNVPIFNVAFPVNRDIVIIDTDKIKPGLARFV